jgi:hypothetical protein
MMVDFEAVIRHFWPKALHAIRSWGEDVSDEKGFRAIRDKNLATRQADLREWLESFSVFLGLTTIQRDQITEAVLAWADARNPGRDLATPEALAEAHKELERTCQTCIMNRPDAKEREFTSLASKALWLCYPERVPLYDRYAKNALHVIAKLEEGVNLIAETKSEYEKFVHVWKQLYERYSGTIESLEVGSYPYRVRVFDVVLWLIGQPSYRADRANLPL